MKFLRLGFVAAFVLALSGQAFAAAPAAPKIDPKLQAQGMKEAPAVLQGAGVNCAVSDAVFLGSGDAKVAGKAVKSMIYEAVCGADMGYIVIATPGADAQAFDCLTLKEDNDKKLAAKQKGGTLCTLPGNADPKMGLAPLLAKGGASCSPITGAHWLGASPTDKISLFEASCGNGPGYIITIPQAGSTKTLDVTGCMRASTVGVDCTLTTAAQVEQSIIKLSDAAGKPACKPTKARWVVTDPATKNDYYEVGCADGSTGYMFRTEANGSFKAVIECVLAIRIAGGCTLSNADAGQTAEAATYTKLAKAIPYDCNVSKYQSYGTEAGGPREIVELACADHPEGAFAFVPTGNGQTGAYYNCLRATTLVGLNCRLSPIEATYALISKEIAARGKTTCTVNGGRGVGKTADGSDYLEVTCAGGPGLSLKYSKLPQETLVGAVPCAQAEITDACKMQKK